MFQISGCWSCPRDITFQISGLQDIREVMKDTPIHHLQRWILGGQEDGFLLDLVDFVLQFDNFLDIVD